VSLASKLKTLSRAELGSILFYIVSGVILLALLPLANFPPHLALIGIFSLITGAIVLIKPTWSIWFVFIMFVTATTFALWTVFSIGFSNGLVTAGLVGYAVLTWLVTIYLGLYRNSKSS
jgi:hypothetical protein